MPLLSIIEQGHDTMARQPNLQCLVERATEQHGHFTRAQADECGYRTNLLTYLAQRGAFVRIQRGVYRLRDYPSYPREDVVAAWLAIGRDVAVVSHESALDLHGLSDVIPNAVHLTVPRSVRYRTTLPGVKIHTTTREFAPGEVGTREGIRVTSVERTIVDSADWGTGPEQIEMAVRQALRRGMTTPRRLEAASAGRSKRVRDLLARSISLAE